MIPGAEALSFYPMRLTRGGWPILANFVFLPCVICLESLREALHQSKDQRGENKAKLFEKWDNERRQNDDQQGDINRSPKKA